MMSGMYAAISGLDAHQTMLDVTANNLANVDTIGYKAQSAQFSDELSQLIQPGTAANGFSAGTNPLQVGLGTQIGSIDNVMTAGGVESTGNATDVAIQGNGWLRVANGNVSTTPPTLDATQYTRAGDLTFNSSGYLCSQTGQYVLGYGATQNAHHRHLLGQHRRRRKQSDRGPAGIDERYDRRGRQRQLPDARGRHRDGGLHLAVDFPEPGRASA